MKSIFYDVDPGGNVELILRNPNTQNIVPDYTDITSCGPPTDPTYANPPCLGAHEVFSELYSGDQNATDEVEIRMRVASGHLSLASRVFRAMLHGPWSEGTSSSELIRQIAAEDWDVVALAIVLDAIHGRHCRIPESINAGLLTRIATIVDYYDCYEPLLFLYRTWMSARYPPSELCKRTLMCLYVAKVFHDEKKFRISASSFLFWSTGSQIETNDLPIGEILFRLEIRRKSLMSRVLAALDTLEEEMKKEEGCPWGQDNDCVAINLGTLNREKYKMIHGNPPLIAPFDGHSLVAMLDKIEKFHTPSLPHSIFGEEPFAIDFDGNHDLCTVQGRLKPILEGILKKIPGVDVADFHA